MWTKQIKDEISLVKFHDIKKIISYASAITLYNKD